MKKSDYMKTVVADLKNVGTPSETMDLRHTAERNQVYLIILIGRADVGLTYADS